MSKRPDSLMSRLTLWQWGLLLIVAGLVANVFMGELMPPPPGGSAAARGQAFGRAAASLLAVAGG